MSCKIVILPSLHPTATIWILILWSTNDILFAIIAIGYVVTTALVFIKPNNVISYYVILVGTVAIIIVYYLRAITGIPVLGTDLWIKDYTTDHRDVITKIAQQAFVIPLAMMLQRVYDAKKQKEEFTIQSKK